MFAPATTPCPVGPFRAVPPACVPSGVTLPASPDKSISQRALMLGLLAEGTTHISNILTSEDVASTARCVMSLGAQLNLDADGVVKVHGVGKRGLSTPSTPLDFGNSGTGCRLMMGLVAGAGIGATFTGDESLSQRPMARILDPLRQMGAKVEGNDRLPIRFLPGQRLRGIDYTTPVASAQIKSSVLLAGLGAQGETKVREAQATRPHTEDMLRAFGVQIEIEDAIPGRTIALRGGQSLSACEINVPGDPSSAAFPLAAAMVMGSHETVLTGLLAHPTRTGFLRLLHGLSPGALAITSGIGDHWDVAVTGQRWQGGNVGASEIADLIDEVPIFAVLAALSEAGGTIRGAHELRVKESDRIATTVGLLRAAGIEVEEHPDGMTIAGRTTRPPGGGHVRTHHDHRIAMSAVVLSLACETPLVIDDGSMIATSYPTFFDDLARLGVTTEPA